MMKSALIYSLLACIVGFVSYPLRPSGKSGYNYSKDGYVDNIANNQSIHYVVSTQLNPTKFRTLPLEANQYITDVSSWVSAKVKPETLPIKWPNANFQAAGRVIIKPDIPEEAGQTRVEVFMDPDGTRVMCQTIDATKVPEVSSNTPKDAILFEDRIYLKGTYFEGDPRKSLTRNDDPAYDPTKVADNTVWSVSVTISSIGYAYLSGFNVKVGDAYRRWKLDRPEYDSNFSMAYFNALHPTLGTPEVKSTEKTVSIDQQPTGSMDESLLPQGSLSNEVVVVQAQGPSLHIDILDAMGRSTIDPLVKANDVLNKPTDHYRILQLLAYLFQCENVTALSVFTKKNDEKIKNIFMELVAQPTTQTVDIAKTALSTCKDAYRYAERNDAAAQQLLSSIDTMVTAAAATITPPAQPAPTQEVKTEQVVQVQAMMAADNKATIKKINELIGQRTEQALDQASDLLKNISSAEQVALQKDIDDVRMNTIEMLIAQGNPNATQQAVNQIDKLFDENNKKIETQKIDDIIQAQSIPPLLAKKDEQSIDQAFVIAQRMNDHDTRQLWLNTIDDSIAGIINRLLTTYKPDDLQEVMKWLQKINNPTLKARMQSELWRVRAAQGAVSPGQQHRQQRPR